MTSRSRQADTQKMKFSVKYLKDFIYFLIFIVLAVTI